MYSAPSCKKLVINTKLGKVYYSEYKISTQDTYEIQKRFILVCYSGYIITYLLLVFKALKYQIINFYIHTNPNSNPMYFFFIIACINSLKQYY